MLLPVVASVVCAVVLVGCGGSSPTSTGNGVSSSPGVFTPTGTKIKGGTVTWAESPASTPNFIFPMTSGQTASVPNANQLAALLFRPLYWIGNDNKVSLDESYSLAEKPVFSDGDTVVTIKMKPWKWSDGETVTSRDLLFQYNLIKYNKTDWSQYSPGEFPDNVKSATTPNSSTLVFHLTHAVSPNWFLYNQLELLTPMPLAWDRTSLSQPAPTKDNGHLPDTTKAGAQAVYKFLSTQGAKLSTFATNPLWKVVDGPWHLSAFTNTGEATFVPNTKYSGSPKPTISKFIEVPYTSDTAEYDVLRTGPSHLTIGYIPAQDYPQEPRVRSSGYKTLDAYGFVFSLAQENFNNPTIGKVFDQLYFRQAFQHLVDQQGWIKHFMGGVGTTTYSPVPVTPPNTFADSYTKKNPYPFSIKDTVDILKAHGWDVKPNGVTTCARAGTAANDCGAGIPAGFKLEFNFDYASGSTVFTEMVNALASNASQAGIKLEVTEHPFDTVAESAVPCQSTQASCKWSVEMWGLWSLDAYPTGEGLYKTGAPLNFGSYSDPKMDTLIDNSLSAPAATAQSALDAYQNYAAQQLPAIWMPNIGSVDAVSEHLGGFDLNAFYYLTPENWYLTK